MAGGRSGADVRRAGPQLQIRRAGPQFLVAGFPRTGTSYLHEQLRSHPGLWLPPMKEIYYWSWQRGRGRWNRRQREYLRAFPGSVGRALAGARDGWTDVAWGLRYLAGRPGDAWWCSLFPSLPGRVTGQVEPTYAGLDDPSALARCAPDLKLVFLLRDPIDRAWSAATKQLARRLGRPMDRFPDAQVMDKLDRQGLPLSRYLEHLERWESAFPRERFLHAFYEELREDPARLVDRVSVHVGAGPHPALDPEALRRRVNDVREFRAPIPARFERHLAGALVGPTRRLAERFGGPTRGWLERMERVLAGPAPG